MAYSASPQIDTDTCKEMPFPRVIALSVALHVVILVVVPLVTKFFWKPRKFERPKTFQLVTAPIPPRPDRWVPIQKEAPKQRVPIQEKLPEPKPVPSPKPAPKTKEKTPQPKKEAARPIEENLDELASLLEELPAPAQVSAIGDFKYHWYLNNVQQKLERHWNPPSELKNMKVIVAFTIFIDGSISEPSISRSSGNSTIDNLALRAVKLAAPFGKLPPGFDGDRLDLNSTFNPTRK